MPISSISGITAAPAAAGIEPAGHAGKPGEFKSVLNASINRLESLRTDASQAVDRLLSGEGEELHTALLATQRAELAFELGLQVRNKVVQAYQEIMRMQM